jgi:hypothetical protein
MSGSMSGVWKRGTARRKGRQQICSAYSHRATLRLYPLRTLDCPRLRLTVGQPSPGIPELCQTKISLSPPIPSLALPQPSSGNRSLSRWRFAPENRTSIWHVASLGVDDPRSRWHPAPTPQAAGSFAQRCRHRVLPCWLLTPSDWGSLWSHLPRVWPQFWLVRASTGDALILEKTDGRPSADTLRVEQPSFGIQPTCQTKTRDLEIPRSGWSCPRTPSPSGSHSSRPGKTCTGPSCSA